MRGIMIFSLIPPLDALFSVCARLRQGRPSVMRRVATSFAAGAILATLTFSSHAQERTAQGTMGGSMMDSGMGPSRAAPGRPSRRSSETETLCGFSGGNPSRGAAIYAQTCVACHGQNGQGSIPGAPDFTKKGGVLRKPHSALQAHIRNGFRSPNSPLSMPAGGGNPSLTDQDLRDVHAYLHKAFGCG